MAKGKERPVSLVKKVERCLRDTLASIPELSKCSEREYCEAVAEAAEVIREGAEARLFEIDNDEPDEE